jgi:DNA invertase Pin-like site-specific DNA recombinase
MLIGYARTSTTEQVAGFEAQRRDLEVAGCTRIFAEQVSSVAQRDELAAALDYLRDGDVLTVTKLDRLARSMRDLVEIVARIEAKGAGLRILAMNLDTTTPTGRLMMNVLGSVAEWERSVMLERQRDGIAKAKAAGKYRGRARTAMAKASEVEAMLAGGIGPQRRRQEARDRSKFGLPCYARTRYHQANVDWSKSARHIGSPM